MKIKDSIVDKNGYRLNRIYSHVCPIITKPSPYGYVSKNRRMLVAEYIKDKSVVPIYFPNLKPTILNKRILKEELSNKSMFEVFANNIDNLDKIQFPELPILTKSEIEELINLLPSDTDKIHIYVSLLIHKAYNQKQETLSQDN